MRHHVLASVLSFVVISVAAARAEAQSSAIAEQLFNEARDLTKSGRWAEACPRFEASLKQDPALGTRLNLANCYEKVGKLASAWGAYREAAALAQKAGDSKRSEYAQKQAQLLEPRLPKLTITLASTAPSGLTVQRDGTPVSAAELGLGLYVDPGAHEVTASAPGYVAFSQRITTDEGTSETLVIPGLKPAANDDEVTATKSGEPVEASAPVSPTRKYIGLGIGGAGIVAVGVGLVFGAQAMAANEQAKELCGDDLACSSANFEKGKRLIDDGRTKAVGSTVFVIAGGAAIAAGVLVYLTAPRAKEQRTARLVPLIHASGAGIGVAGSF